MEEKLAPFKGISYRAAAGQNRGDWRLRSVLGHARRVAVPPGQSRLSCAFDPAPSTMPHSIDPGSYRSPDPQRSAVPLPIETEPRTHDPYAAFRFGDFALFTAGHLADRFSRKHIILWSQVFSALMSLALALVSWKHLFIPQIAPLREGNRVLAAVATIFERHHPIFQFD